MTKSIYFSPEGIDALAKTIWLAEFERAFSRKPTDPWDNQADKIKEGHRNTARKILEAGYVTPSDSQRDRRLYIDASRNADKYRRECDELRAITPAHGTKA